MKSELVEKYLRLEKKRKRLVKAGKEGTPEEDNLLAEMDVVWYSMTTEEMEYVNRSQNQ